MPALKTPQQSNGSQHILASIRTAAATQVYHYEAGGRCIGCDVVANTHRNAILMARQQEPIYCDGVLLELVSQTIRLLSSHLETHTTHYLNWFDNLCIDLWEFAKQLKDETNQDSRSSYLTPPSSPSEDKCIFESPENYRRAIRTEIYHFRGSMNEYASTNIREAIQYYRKCLGVPPSLLPSHYHLQQSATAALQRLGNSDSSFKSRTSSVSSRSLASSSSSSTSCSSCGKEKRVMPVCAKCKTQSYCGMACLKADKVKHSAYCAAK
ncbi:hypothetical protein CLU79DRAFT_773694 [Phycomyces nitens]|nr:hypothetical protein CLU79DRAFT_773694 [Phycomyces nitens]